MIDNCLFLVAKLQENPETRFASYFKYFILCTIDTKKKERFLRNAPFIIMSGSIYET